jgi:hypothetical protein
MAVTANTSLHQPPPITPTAGDNNPAECTTAVLDSLQPGQVVWHFILNQTTAVDTGTLHATFSDPAAEVSQAPDKVVGPDGNQVVHWTVITDSNTLTGAHTDGVTDGGLLNLSHTCVKPVVAVDSHTSTTIHNANHGAITEADLGSTVHDSATVTVDNNVAIPAGSTASSRSTRTQVWLAPTRCPQAHRSIRRWKKARWRLAATTTLLSSSAATRMLSSQVSAPTSR